ncbi:phage tail protein [Kordiimonas aestuarii]|uniref:phage tail protein n=1 Tax=Kordiimonas aestuarii TaxID=1005925 RepID=UPI0021D2DB4A|nr:phage tail protein [Kordiimonas aestuarii]
MVIPAVLTHTGPTENVWDPRYGEFVPIHDGDIYPAYRPDQVGTSQARWTTDAVIDPKENVIDNLKKLLEGFGWSMPWSNGRHRLVLEDLVSGPVMTVTEDDILGGWTCEHGLRQGRLNRVTVEFSNANKDYEEDAVSWPLLDSPEYADFKAHDNGAALHTNVPVKTITDYYQAQAFAEFLVRKSRVGFHVEGLKLARKALLLEPGDVIEVDYPERGFDARLFIVEKISVSAFLEVEVDLALYDPTVYGGEAIWPEPLNSVGDAPDLWADPGAPTDLQLVSFHEAKADGSMISGIDVNWDAPTSTVGMDRFELKWRKAGDAEYTGQRYLGRDTLSARISGLVDGAFYDVQLTYWTQRGQESLAAGQMIELPATPSKLDDIEPGATRNVFRGVYDDTATYVRGDVVTYDGSSFVFISLSAATGVEPTNTTFWTLLAGQGPQGVPGAPGVDGQTTYTWIRYADSAAGAGISNDPTGRAYIGFAYNKPTAAESNTPADYIWSLVQGPQGNTGVAGAPGADGQTTYTWIKYSANADGTGLTDTPQANTVYIGIAVNKTTASESNNKADYVWSRWKGEQGIQGPQGVAGAPGADGQTTYTWIRYASNASGSGISNDPSGKAYIGFAYNKTSPYESNIASDYTWSLIQGAQGNTGVAGAPGADGQTTYTWIKYSANADGTGLTDTPQSNTKYIGIATNKTTASESTNKSHYTWSQWRGEDGSSGLTINASPTSHTVACSPDGTPKSGEFNKTSQVALFAGTSNVAASASYSRVASNCSASVSGSGLVTITGMSDDSAFVDVTASYGGVSLTVRISLSKSRDGTSATYAEGDVYPATATSYTQHTSPGVLTLALSGGGTVHMAAQLNFRASGSGDTQYMRFQRRPSGGTWETVLTADPVFGESTEPAFMTANHSYAAPSTAGVWDYRLLQRHAGSGASLQNNPGSFSVRLG